METGRAIPVKVSSPNGQITLLPTNAGTGSGLAAESWSPAESRSPQDHLK
jgi:hypothetical protein